MDANLVGIVLASLLMLCLALVYVGVVILPVFEYRFGDSVLTIRRRAFRVLPSGTWHVQLANILRAERTGFWRFPLRGETYCAGRWWAREGVVLTLKQAVDGFDRVYVTPPDSALFVAEMAGRLGDAILAPAPPPTDAERRLATRRGDALASVAAVSFCVCLTITVGGVLGLFAESGAALVAAIACMVVFLPMVLWMWYDCVIALGEKRQRRLAFWLLAQFLFFPSAWLYYLIEWRPRAFHPRGSSTPLAP